jgi:hypothetical protein
VRFEQPDQAVPQQEEVLGDDNAHGTSIATIVGPPARLPTTRIPSNVASRLAAVRRIMRAREDAPVESSRLSHACTDDGGDCLARANGAAARLSTR